LRSIATIAAKIKKNGPDAASHSQADWRVRNDAARPLDVLARSITFKVEQPRAFSPATAFLWKGTAR
jgi:hypothetical protein